MRDAETGHSRTQWHKNITHYQGCKFCLYGHFLERAIQRIKQELKMLVCDTNWQQRHWETNVRTKDLVLATPPQENGGLWRHRLQHIERKFCFLIQVCQHDTLRQFLNPNYSSERNKHDGCARPPWPVHVLFTGWKDEEEKLANKPTLIWKIKG